MTAACESTASKPDQISELAHAMKSAWRSRPAVQLTLYSFREVTSTMDWIGERVRESDRETDRNDPAYVGSFGSGTGWIAAVAEEQSAGRGRNSRSWHSPSREGIYLTISRELRSDEKIVGASPLIAAVGMRRAVARLGSSGCRIKWPNDLLLFDPEQNRFRKLGGILVEGSTRGDSTVISVGVGLNLVQSSALCELGGVALEELRSPGSEGSSPIPPYVECVAVVLDELCHAVEQGLRTGFPAFKQEWVSGAAYIGEYVVVRRPADGMVAGAGLLVDVDDDGSLILEEDDRAVRRFVSGELSLRTSEGGPLRKN